MTTCRVLQNRPNVSETAQAFTGVLERGRKVLLRLQKESLPSNENGSGLSIMRRQKHAETSIRKESNVFL